MHERQECQLALQAVVEQQLEGLRAALDKGSVAIDEPLLFEGRQRTLLQIAASVACVDICSFLLERGADANWQAPDGQTALHCACLGSNRGCRDVIDLLIQRGADSELRDAKGRRPVDYLITALQGEPMKCGEHVDEQAAVSELDRPAYSSDDFRMYSFKVLDCKNPDPHDWTDCPFSHPGEKAHRRDPRQFLYTGVPCPEFRKGTCKRGDTCPFAHGVFECWLHPSRYRTQLCKDAPNCSRRVCFFAHTLEQLRTPDPADTQFLETLLCWEEEPGSPHGCGSTSSPSPPGTPAAAEDELLVKQQAPQAGQDTPASQPTTPTGSSSGSHAGCPDSGSGGHLSPALLPALQLSSKTRASAAASTCYRPNAKLMALLAGADPATLALLPVSTQHGSGSHAAADKTSSAAAVAANNHKHTSKKHLMCQQAAAAAAASQLLHLDGTCGGGGSGSGRPSSSGGGSARSSLEHSQQQQGCYGKHGGGSHKQNKKGPQRGKQQQQPFPYHPHPPQHQQQLDQQMMLSGLLDHRRASLDSSAATAAATAAATVAAAQAALMQYKLQQQQAAAASWYLNQLLSGQQGPAAAAAAAAAVSAPMGRWVPLPPQQQQQRAASTAGGVNSCPAFTDAAAAEYYQVQEQLMRSLSLDGPAAAAAAQLPCSGNSSGQLLGGGWSAAPGGPVAAAGDPLCNRRSLDSRLPVLDRAAGAPDWLAAAGGAGGPAPGCMPGQQQQQACWGWKPQDLVLG